MKSISVAVLTIAFCITAVIAAPSSLAGSDIEPEDKVKIWNCIVKSVEKSVEGTEIEPVIDEYKSTLYPLVHSLKTCLRDVRGNDRLECQSHVTNKLFLAVNKFVNVLSTEIEVRKEIEKCSKQYNTFKMSAKSELLDGLRKPIDYINSLKCVLESMENGVKGTKLDVVYEKYKPYLQKQLEEMTSCMSNEIGQKQVDCVNRKVDESNKTLFWLYHNMGEIDSVTFAKILDDIHRICGKNHF